MHRRTFLKAGLASAVAAAVLPQTAMGERLKPPNILWLSAEDISPDLGCYGDAYADTPNIDAFAARAVRYDRAYSHSGVCAPSRSGIITGMYPTSIGTQHMRCSGLPPAGVKCFPEYLRAAGYYCTNNSKTDYQFDAPLSAWDESSKNAHWKNRPDDAPFFSVFNFTSTHESQVRNQAPELQHEISSLGTRRHDPDAVVLPPYHADTPATRRDWAQYYDIITLMDQEFAAALAELEEAGLAEDTIVWFWGDHGRGLTRCKRWLYESGTRVPLLVHVPEKYREWVRPSAPDSLASGVCDDLVCFIDFAPTVLSLAGVSAPAHFHGQAFLGPDQPTPRDYVYGARDRMDEAYDCIRTVRDKQYRYFRNYMPWLSYAQTISYMDEMPMAQDLRRLHAEGKLNADQGRWFAPTKPLEELYDVDADPHELSNLAADPTYSDVLKRLRAAHMTWVETTRDTGLLPEPEMDAMKWPDGRIPQCARPVPLATGGKLALASNTPGASLVYRWSDDAADTWRLYSAPLALREHQTLSAIATRIGYKNSAKAQLDSTSASEEMVGPDADRDAGAWAEEAERNGLLAALRAMRQRELVDAMSEADYVAQLDSPQASLRYWAIVALSLPSESGLAQASRVTEILRFLEDPSPCVRVAAARAAGGWGQVERALPVLESALTDESQSVRLYAAIALRDLGEAARPALPALNKARTDPWSYVQRVSSQAVEAIGSPQ